MILTIECNSIYVNDELKKLQTKGHKIIDIKFTAFQDDNYCLIIYEDNSIDIKSTIREE